MELKWAIMDIKNKSINCNAAKNLHKNFYKKEIVGFFDIGFWSTLVFRVNDGGFVGDGWDWILGGFY